MDERVHKFAADLIARLGARAHLVAQEQASNASGDIAAVWRNIADTVGHLQEHNPELLNQSRSENDGPENHQNGGAYT